MNKNKYDIDLEISNKASKEIMDGRKQQATGLLFVIAGIIMIIAIYLFADKINFIKPFERKPAIVVGLILLIFGVANFVWGKVKVWSAKG